MDKNLVKLTITNTPETFICFMKQTKNSTQKPKDSENKKRTQ